MNIALVLPRDNLCVRVLFLLRRKPSVMYFEFMLSAEEISSELDAETRTRTKEISVCYHLFQIVPQSIEAGGKDCH